jgi:hypothetical protein
MSLASRADYERLLFAVRSVVHRWDPYGLLAGGAPQDEFDREIALIAARIRDIKTEKDAVQALSSVFTDAFEAETFTPELCSTPGKELFAALRNGGFLQKE